MNTLLYYYSFICLFIVINCFPLWLNVCPVTHVVVPDAPIMPSSLTTLQGVLSGCWILTFSCKQWVKALNCCICLYLDKFTWILAQSECLFCMLRSLDDRNIVSKETVTAYRFSNMCTGRHYLLCVVWVMAISVEKTNIKYL